MKVVQNPNGFLVITLTAGADGSAQRLHVWDRPGGDGDIHQHRADFTSTIIEGTMHEEIYACDSDPAGDWDLLRADCWSSPDGEYHVDETEPRRRCTPGLLRTETHLPGETYERDGRDLHRVVAVTVPLVTMVTFGPIYQRVHTLLQKRP